MLSTVLVYTVHIRDSNVQSNIGSVMKILRPSQVATSEATVKFSKSLE